MGLLEFWFIWVCTPSLRGAQSKLTVQRRSNLATEADGNLPCLRDAFGHKIGYRCEIVNSAGLGLNS
jgi:hypothetical protein